MVETTLDAMGVDLSLIEAAAPKRSQRLPNLHRPQRQKPAEKKPEPKPAPVKAVEEKAPPAKQPAPVKAAAKPAVEEEEALMGLTKDDVQGLKEMVGFFKALKTALGGEAPAGKAKAPLRLRPDEEEGACTGPIGLSMPSTPRFSQVSKEQTQRANSTAFHRARTMPACPIGKGGTCCKLCNMGPCRVLLPRERRDAGGTKEEMRPLRRHPETIAARNFARMVAAGTRPTAITDGTLPIPSCTLPKANCPIIRSKTFRNSLRWPWTTACPPRAERSKT